MSLTELFLALVLVHIGSCQSFSQTFPDDFVFGAATSAYQIEGGWNAGGKGVSRWDTITHTLGFLIADGSNGDIACDSYNKYELDVGMLKDLGVQYYRFSLAWTRILPTGFSDNINAVGVQYYNNLIDRLLENNIQPLVTLFHWDTPQAISSLGDFKNKETIGYFKEYAKIAFQLFGDRVKMWATFNEPKSFCIDLPGPLVELDKETPYPVGIMEYMCTHNLLMAHAEVYHMYHQEFTDQEGKIGIVLNLEWEEAATTDPADLEAAETRRQFQFGLFANPIVHGNYPQVVMDRVANRSTLEGFPESRLPTFSIIEMMFVRGTYDYLGINAYSSWYIDAAPEAPIDTPSFNKDQGGLKYQLDSWEPSGISWLKITPWGLRNFLKWTKDTYNDPDIYITENGYADNTGTLEDDTRVSYYRQYLNETLKAIYLDNVKVKGHFAWSLMDNFEWASGYTVKFGLYQVNFGTRARTRTAKKSATYLKGVYASRTLQ